MEGGILWCRWPEGLAEVYVNGYPGHSLLSEIYVTFANKIYLWVNIFKIIFLMDSSREFDDWFNETTCRFISPYLDKYRLSKLKSKISNFVNRKKQPIFKMSKFSNLRNGIYKFELIFLNDVVEWSYVLIRWGSFGVVKRVSTWTDSCPRQTGINFLRSTGSERITKHWENVAKFLF